VTDERTPTGDYEALEVADASSGGAPTDTAPSIDSAATLASQLDALRIAAGKTEALAATVVESYDHADWGGADRVLVERMAYLLGVVAEAAREAVAAVDRFHGLVADRQRAGGDEWW
jgi:hypothetical protein